ncbi:MAG: undecaprenyl-phosphate glucose phosphotransferase [Chloroflexi bacterium]|nr:undecaprenyl-phosphate glucose phosphotransferase [Chloroflexota bacterium]
MRKSANVYFVIALILSDAFVTAFSYLASYELRFRSNLFSVQELHPQSVYLGPMILQMFVGPIVLSLQGLYRPRRAASGIDEFYSIFSGVSVATVMVMAASAVASRDFGYSRLMLALVWLLSIVFVTLGRALLSRIQSVLRAQGLGIDRVLIIGTGDIAGLVLNKIRNSPGLGYRAIGFVTEEPGLASVHGLRVLGCMKDVDGLIREHRVTEVIVALPTLSHRQLLEIVSHCQRHHVSIKCFPDLFQIMASEVNIDDLDGMPLVTIRDVALKGWNLVVKRLMDLVISAATLVALSPFLLLVALLVKVTSPGGPVFYVQERVGLDGKPFPTIKFRTMKPHAEQETGPVWATEGDPRTTWLGRVLRRYSIDEMPQFINVLAGEMSLVGPRPERPYFVEQFKQTVPRYFDRHNEKAGITGWAQVNGLRGNTSIEQRTAYDLWYVENWTLWLDFKILIRTLFVIFRDKNAY